MFLSLVTPPPQIISLGMDFANLEDLPLSLPGIELERVKIQRSMLMEQVGGGGGLCAVGAFGGHFLLAHTAESW